MARKGPVEIVQLPLTEDFEPKVKALIADGQDLSRMIDEMLTAGYNLSLSYNADKGEYSVSVYGHRSVANSGKLFYANAPDYVSALAVACVKHFFVSNGEWSSVRASRSLYS